ncbi:hypothetical protein VQ056_15815 [Paenibacillus sp. JTLBN-2024]
MVADRKNAFDFIQREQNPGRKLSFGLYFDKIGPDLHQADAGEGFPRFEGRPKADPDGPGSGFNVEDPDRLQA